MTLAYFLFGSRREREIPERIREAIEEEDLR